MQATSIIGPSITITGDISAGEPLTIAGRVDGTISILEHSLTIDSAGRVHADVHAATVTVSGHVTGSLLATSWIAVGATAIIDGDLSAPLLKVEDGAHLRGKVDVEGTTTAAGLRFAS
jgi:cytoskeletal protein CcmA (bactofilin family)